MPFFLRQVLRHSACTPPPPPPSACPPVVPVMPSPLPILPSMRYTAVPKLTGVAPHFHDAILTRQTSTLLEDAAEGGCEARATKALVERSS